MPGSQPNYGTQPRQISPRFLYSHHQHQVLNKTFDEIFQNITFDKTFKILLIQFFCFQATSANPIVIVGSMDISREAILTPSPPIDIPRGGQRSRSWEN